MTIEFEEFPKIARLSRECIITEKLDGTNAQVLITEDMDSGQRFLQVGSRSRWITPEEHEEAQKLLDVSHTAAIGPRKADVANTQPWDELDAQRPRRR